MRQLRVARATDDLERVVAMYREGLGLEVLGAFEDHAGFDGVMLGRPGEAYHLEFTRERGARREGTPGPESLLVFYEPDAARWEETCEAMLAAGFSAVPAHNPYWDRDGRSFADFEGYRVVIQRGRWPRP